jgi:endoglucanase
MLRACPTSALIAMVACLLACAPAPVTATEQDWPAWQRFKQLYLSRDGRVIDASEPQQITTSEGQSYALFFALVANDPESFATVLRWTQNNLAGGDLRRQLPAWQWGRADDGAWQVLDPNPAADADLWIAYSLAQAARLWCEPGFAALSEQVANRILREEVTLIPGLGPTLLPGPKGFVEQQTWRLNASYVPIQLLRSLARNDVQWRAVLKSSERMIFASAPRGFAADWIQYRTAEGFASDRVTGSVGSYNAIRVYLWAGMLPSSDPLHSRLTQHFAPMVASTAQRAAPMESIEVDTLASSGTGSPGFSAALLPLLANAKLSNAVRVHRERVQAQSLKDAQSYYSDVLSLFGLGWLEQRYQFSATGSVSVTWKQQCAAR